jgi:hypothetical protein
MRLEAHAGNCVNGGRHSWRSKEFRISKGAFTSLYGTICAKCQRIRITEYTKRGNHVAGYRQASVDEIGRKVQELSKEKLEAIDGE